MARFRDAALSLALLTAVAGCDSGGVTPPPPPPPVVGEGSLVFMYEDESGGVSLGQVSAPGREMGTPRRIEFENVSGSGEIYTSSSLDRMITIGSLRNQDLSFATISNLDGSNAQRAFALDSYQGTNDFYSYLWSPEGDKVLLDRINGNVWYVNVASDNTSSPRVLCATCNGLSYDGVALPQIMGSNWSRTSGKIVVAASEAFPADPFDQSLAHLYEVDLASGTVERRLSTEPIRANFFNLSIGAEYALARRGYNGRRISFGLHRQSGESLGDMQVPSLTTGMAVGVASVKWTGDSDLLTIFQPLRAQDSETGKFYSLGVIDTNDSKLRWSEYADLMPSGLIDLDIK